MKIEFSHAFIKRFKKRISHLPALREKFEERTRLFIKNSQNPLLEDHPLKGDKLGMRAFSVTGDIRVVYYILEGTAYFVDIGTHNKVY